jgi:hypothetical protein
MQQYKKQNFFEERLISEAMMKTLNLKYVPLYLRDKEFSNFYWNLESKLSKQNITGAKSFAPFDFYTNNKSIKYVIDEFYPNDPLGSNSSMIGDITVYK